MIERIRSHAGQGSSALFEILWKLGDVTWLPYEQITKSTALEDYLESQEAKGVRSLPKGLGKPPKDLELIISIIGWELEKLLAGYKVDEEDQETHGDRSRSMQPTGNWFLKCHRSHFLLLDPYGNDRDRKLSASHVREILSFDRLLRSCQHGDIRPPTDYDRIAAFFNSDHTCSTKLMRLSKTGSITVLGPPPTFDDRDNVPQPCSPTSERLAAHRSNRDDQEIARVVRLVLEADRKAPGKKGSVTRQERLGRRSSLSGATELHSYTTPGPSSSSQRAPRVDVPIDHVPTHAFETEDTVMVSDAEAVEEDSFDTEPGELVKNANTEDAGEYE
jgi:hypothetical protein